MEALWAFAPLIILLVIYVIARLYKQGLKNDLQEKIAWLSKANLFFSVSDVQSQLIAPIFCKLSSGEEEYARAILQHFSKQRESDFVQERLPYNRATYKMTNVCYFMHSLYFFLSNWDFSRDFLNHKLYSIAIQEFFNDNDTQIETRELTDFGKTFCKLLYISLRYCEIYSSSPLRDSDNIQKNLETGKITFQKL